MDHEPNDLHIEIVDQRLVARVDFHWGASVSWVGFIVPSLDTDSRAVVRLCNQNGTAQQWIRKG